MSAAPVLETDNLTLFFNSVAAFADVSFSVDEGEIFAVIGPNGAGKTSLFNVISRVYRPARGTVRYLGGDLLRLRRSQIAGAGIARTFQNLGLFGNLSVLENVLIGRHHLMRSGTLRGGLYLGFAQLEERSHRAAAMEALEFGRRESSPTACRSASSWRGRWRCNRDCCCWTNRWRGWAPRSAARSSP